MQGLGQLIYTGLPSRGPPSTFHPKVAIASRQPVGGSNSRPAKCFRTGSRLAIFRSASSMETERPTRLSHALLAVALVAAIAVAIWRAPYANWDMGLLAILLGFSVLSDVMSIETESRIKVSGNFLALVLALVFLGGTPA